MHIHPHSKLMKRNLPTLLLLLVASAAWAQPMTYYVNDGVVQCPPDIPPQIDALNFINNNSFTIIDTNILIPNSRLYDTSDTINFTNSASAVMVGDPGFQFDTAPSGSGLRQRAGAIYNAGRITVGTGTNTVIGFIVTGTGTNVPIFASLPKLICNATNIINPGVINLGFESLCSLSAENINMNRGTLAMGLTGLDSFNFSYYFNGGIFDGYWGLGTNVFSPRAYFERIPAITPVHIVTNRYYQTLVTQLGNRPGEQAYVDDILLDPSNRLVRAVFVSNTNLDLNVRTFFPLGFDSGFYGDIVVEWSAAITNQGGIITSNYVYLFDSFMTDFFPPNFAYGLFANGFAGPNTTYVPLNLIGPLLPNFLNGGFFQTTVPEVINGEAFPMVVPPGTFNANNTTNQYSAYQGMFVPSSAVPADIGTGNITNLPGRISLSADKVMDLSYSHISSLNYLLLRATNHYKGSDRAKISAPYLDIDLRSTNGLMVITNLLSPVLGHAEGTIDCYSCRWTNVTGTLTNLYHVLVLDTQISPSAPSRIQNLTLHTTNTLGGPDTLVIRDQLNILSNSFTLDCARLILQTNDVSSLTPAGGINLLSPNIVWSTSTPRLQFLTNYGSIQTLNAVFFGGLRSSPYYNTTYSEPYNGFYNRGTVTNFGSLIWAQNFENYGSWMSIRGTISLQAATNAVLTNGTFSAEGIGGNINIESSSLFVSNHVLRTSGSLTLKTSTLLDDGSLTRSTADYITNKNFWLCTGFNFPQATAGASLLGTTVTNVDPSYANIQNVWAAADLGCTPAGFTNNAAVGNLVLEGRDTDSLFTFTGAGANNAIYVDCLEFRGSIATNVDNAKNYLGVQIDPNIMVYYAQAVANGMSIAERLNGKNGGRFSWVSNYNDGFFSSTNVVYTDGTTNRLNSALVNSCDIDSNGNGVPNCSDTNPIPVLTGHSLALAVTYTNRPAAAALVSWTAHPGSTNWLQTSASADPAAANWQTVTNFFYPGIYPARVTVTDVIRTNGPRFYRVRAGAR